MCFRCGFAAYILQCEYVVLVLPIIRLSLFYYTILGQLYGSEIERDQTSTHGEYNSFVRTLRVAQAKS